MRHSGGECPPEQLRKIEISTQHLLDVINNFLDIFKIEAGKLSIERSNFHLDKLFEYVSSMLGDPANLYSTIISWLLELDSNATEQTLNEASTHNRRNDNEGHTGSTMQS